MNSLPYQDSSSRDLLPTLVERVARSYPDMLAVADGGEASTYAQLLAASDDIGAALRSFGIGRDSVVGLGLARGARRLAATIALWRLGAVPVMLDPSWPALRLRQIGEAAKCTLVLADGEGDFGNVPVWIPGSNMWARGASPETGDASSPDVTPAEFDLAYIVYTSGSTGRPKGVEITHGNLTALVDWHVSAFDITPDDRAAHLAGLGFDAAIWEVWPYLAVGASVHVVPEGTRRDAARLRDWLVDTGVTIAFAPPLLAEALIGLDWPATSLRLLLTGGDRLRLRPPPTLPFALVNNYGPTECTVVACSGPVSPISDGTPPSIGTPIAGAYVRLLDPAGQPVGPGGIGEICIGGALVGRGYRVESEATTAAFVRDPFSEEPGARLYRTGDLGAWRADGAIDFRGRIDDQLKIHGQRVEPDEIAHHLLGHPQVGSATVVGIDRPEGMVLAAYFESADPVPPTGDELRGFLADRLPDAWLPSSFTLLDRLPVTANGKLDKAALPAPSAPAPASQPASPTERRLLEILQGVLGERAIGPDDNFFLIGGHSLLGTQVVLRATEAFGVELTLRHLFNAPTVRSLAKVIERLVEELVAALDEDELTLRVRG